MSPIRFLAPALLALLAAGTARADEILVRGDPPLTRNTVALYQEMWQWYCDITLTPEQRRQLQVLSIRIWPTLDKFTRQRLLTNYATMEKEWREAQQLPAAEREAKRLAVRIQWMNNLRKNTKNIVNRYLVSVYDAAYRPGGRKNPILVRGEPPLTKVLMDQRVRFVEWLLDLSLTAKQRAEHRRLFIKRWKGTDPAQREKLAKGIANWGDWLPGASAYVRNTNRAMVLPRVLAAANVKDANEEDRWVAGLYEATYKPGGPRNPVLVEGAAPLTQALVDRYGDFVEWALDLAPTGGLSGPQRRVLRDYLVKDWPRMDRAARKELLDAVKHWAEVMPLKPEERTEWHKALQPKLVAELRVARDHARSQWLLEVYTAARHKAQQIAQQKAEQLRLQRYAEQLRHESVMDAYRAIMDSPSYRWEYNYSTGRWESRPR